MISAMNDVIQIMTALDQHLLVSISDRDCRIIYVNERFCEVSKYDKDEIIGRTHDFLRRTPPSDALRASVWEKVSKGRTWEGELELVAKDHTLYWVHATIVPFLGEDGLPERYITFRTDITKRKLKEDELLNTHQHLNQTLSELNTVKDAIAESSFIVIFNESGKVQYVNDLVCELSHYERNELLGETYRLLDFTYHRRCSIQTILSVLNKGEVWRGELKHKDKFGHEFWIHGTIIPCKNEAGTCYRYVGIGNNITELKHSEGLLLRSEKLSALGELAAGIAHEIRNPLTTLKGFTSLLLENEKEADKKLYIHLLKEEINRIDQTVNELMSLAKPKPLTLKKSNLHELMQQVWLFLQPELLLHAIEIEWKKSTTVVTDCEENQIKQVLINVMKNAIEAMNRGGTIYLSLYQEEDQIFIHVEDNGPGIPEEHLRMLGNPFYTTKTNGNGLGLLMCNNIMKNHFGRFEIKNREEGGTVVTLVLPYRP
ncbi:PAS domain-containing protein [Jeotgalibacillus aurantiacus]|uniref:PAS domain-containing protein n=1 Tax=Jeotgalibacillus aurantiacus TaxID=2763266 RepID=UPI001D0A227F|nr:PAS domain-containing protein [Jeotgalibacillus aurantiacus]